MNPMIQIKNAARVLSRSKLSNASFFVCVVSLVALATASAQTSPTEGLEKYDNPPAYIYRLETSPRMISQYGPFTSFQVNVDANGNNIVGDAANETSIAVDPTDGSKMAIGWRQFDSVTSNFREAGYGYTTDGGETWTFPGVLQNTVFRSDPVLNSDEAGGFFYLSLESTQGLQFFCDDVWGSLNGGQSWTLLPPRRGALGGDKAWFTIDKTNGMGHGFQYQFWTYYASCDRSGSAFNRSTDSGVTWMNPINIPNSPRFGTLDVGTNGNLFIGGGDGASQFWCIRSSDAQNGNVTPTFDQVTTVNLGGSIIFNGSINPQGIAGQIFLAVDRSGTGTNNNIYMLASVRPNGASNGTDVMFVRSTDGGLSFSAPRRINDDPLNENKWHWFGTLAVAPNGRIDSVWLDTRNAANNTDSQLFYSYSTDGGVTWSANVAVSNPFNPFDGYPNENRKIGDYITIVSDETGGNVAYSATFNHEEDVYYVRVSLTAIADLSVTKADFPDPVTVGNNLTYTVTLTNNGPDPATSVTVTDNLPAETTFVSCSSTGGGVCGGSGNNRTVTFASLASGESESITFVATVNCSVADGTVISNTATVSSFTPDPDTANNSATATTTASNAPPVITGAAANPSVLWPPNHRMVNVTVSYQATDNCPLPTGSCTLSVTSNEPVLGHGSGHTSPDWIVLDDHHVQLRAEREGNGNGRIYTITITCTDSGGNSSSQQVEVRVPHDRGREENQKQRQKI
jgi:uncharacterized repeat protein (TIGR01451 family)